MRSEPTRQGLLYDAVDDWDNVNGTENNAPVTLNGFVQCQINCTNV